MNLDTIYTGDALTFAQSLPYESVNCVVTSPPYFNLRDYGVEGQIGNEQTPAEYVCNLVALFREIRRALKADGTCWLNLGDSYAGSSNNGGYSNKSTLSGFTNPNTKGRQMSNAGNQSGRNMPNFTDCLQSSIKERVLFIGTRCTATIAAHSETVLHNNQFAPDSELSRLFGVQRITFKQRDNNFSQVVYLLNPESDCIIDCSFCFVDSRHIEIILDEGDSLRVIISDVNLDTQSALGVPVFANAVKNSDMAFAIEKTTKPITESVGYVQSNRDALSLYPTSESVLNIDTINQPITFSNTLMIDIQGLRDFRVGKASREQLSLSLFNGAVNLAVDCVSHLYFSNDYGSLVHYSELYHKAEREANTLRPKQLLGIPDLVKRALMEDGWYCRASIVWHKPNPMPESVTDRVTRSHEMVYMLTKSPRYWYDAGAIKEPAKYHDIDRRSDKGRFEYDGIRKDTDVQNSFVIINETRNKRDVWTIPTAQTKEAHFATFPEKLIEPMILAGCPPFGVVYDPFMGSGTTALVARRYGRHYIGSELNPEYVAIAEKQLAVPYMQNMFEVLS